jgi:hypothetical protein
MMFTSVLRRAAVAPICLLLLLMACGDNGKEMLAPPADADLGMPSPDSAPSFTTSCKSKPTSGPDAYNDASDFPATNLGTLKDWDPNGRWFITGIPLGRRANILFEKQGSTVVVDRATPGSGTVNDDFLFNRSSPGPGVTLSIRISDKQPDGTLRLDRAFCDGGMCRVCVARLVRAGWPAGEAESKNIVKVGELNGADWEPGITYNVRVLGDFAYLVRDDGMHIINISNPAQPVQVGHWVSGYSNDVKLVKTATNKTYAIVADQGQSKVVDVTNPAAPVLVQEISESAHTLFTETRAGKTLAYFGNYDATCPVYDVTNPLLPVRVGRFQTAGMFNHDLSVQDGIAYLNAWDAGMYRVDFNNPAAPVETGIFTDTATGTSHSSWPTVVGGRKIVLHGEEAAGAYLKVVDNDPLSPTFMKEIGSYRNRDWVSIHNIMAFGNRAYVSYYQDGVRVFDLSDVTKPTLIGYFNTWDADGPDSDNDFFAAAIGIDVDLSKRLIFVADSPRGLIILRDQTPQ